MSQERSVIQHELRGLFGKIDEKRGPRKKPRANERKVSDEHERLHPTRQTYVGRSADKATAEDVRRYQLWLGSIGTTVPTVNVSATALRFFFKVTLKRRDLAEAVVSVREPRRLPVVLSPEEVGRLLASATNLKHKAALSLTYATGLRSSEAVSLKLTDIDSDRMVIRVAGCQRRVNSDHDVGNRAWTTLWYLRPRPELHRQPLGTPAGASAR